MTISQKKIVLKRSFPGECSLLGDRKVESILSGPVETIRSSGGSNLDISLIVGIIINAATFIDAAINIYTFLKKEKKESPTVNNIFIAIINNPEINITINNLPNINDEKKKEIISLVLNELNKTQEID